MKAKVFIGTTLSCLLATLTVPALAQNEPPTDGAQPPAAAPQEQPPTPPASTPAPVEAPPAAPADVRPAPPADQPGPAPAAESSAEPQAKSGYVMADAEETADTGPTKIGETLSSLVVTAGLGYAYAAVSHPDLTSRNLSGAFIEVGAGTELDKRFRLTLSFTSFETKVRRTKNGKWEEGVYQSQSSAGLRTAADPVEPTGPQFGGIEVQKTFHAHSIGPRMDFLPLGSQGPYIGMTAAVAVIQDVSTRVGADLAARVGGEWRPFHSLGLAVEAGAHGQIYDDSRAAIPYALARMSLMLEPSGTKKGSSTSPPPAQMVMPRTLPPSTPR